MPTAGETIAHILRCAERRLREAGVDTPRGDAEWIASAALCVPRSHLLAHADEPFPSPRRGRFEEMLGRRERRQPLGYVIGTVNFRGLELEVGPGAFVPRPETEITAERSIARARDGSRRRPTVVDVGTGSGAIALAVAAAVPNARVFATEVRGQARAWALRNLARTGLRVTLLPGNLLDPLHPALGGAVDVIVSNPPYVAESEWGDLPDEVRLWEPREALIAGATGLETIMRLVQQAQAWMAPGGWLILETAPHQTAKVAHLLAAMDYEDVTVTPDLAGRERVVEGRWVGPW